MRPLLCCSAPLLRHDTLLAFAASAVYFPAALAAAVVFSRLAAGPCKPAQLQRRALCTLSVLLLQPALLLVDHGHFQYNCISLGLAAAAAASVAAERDILGSVLYCLSLNHKQMGLYYAPAFFFHLLGRALQRHATWLRRLGAVAALGATVLATFAVCWAPYLGSSQAALQVGWSLNDLRTLPTLARLLYRPPPCI